MSSPAVELLDIHKSFSRVKANDGVNLAVARGEIHALVGENGAGKSTLMKILYGLYAPDRGEIRIDGMPARFRGPADALRAGLGMVHQHFMLVRPFTVVENMLLGREGVLPVLPMDRVAASREIRDLAGRYALDVEPGAVVEDLPVGVQQRAEILRVLLHGTSILIFDEPTAVLTPQEATDFFRVLGGLREQGKTILLITHKLDEVMQVADRITVMRAGRVMGERAVRDTSSAELARLMVGRDVALGRVEGEAPAGAPVLEVRSLGVCDSRRIARVNSVSFQVRAGEIVGIAGVEGNGQTELVEAIAGLREVEAGTIHMHGRDVTGSRVAQRQRSGLVHVPEDRQRRGLVLEMSLAENLLLGRQRESEFSGRVLLRAEPILRMARRLSEEFDVRPRDVSLKARDFSGGNQQKIVVARELGRAPRLIVASQPTRGVDIGAIEFIHARLREARDQGVAVLLVSADLREVMSLSDRILVMYGGRVVGEVPGRDAREDHLGTLMLGGAA